MCKKTPLTVAGIVFALVSLAHLARLYFQFPVVIDTVDIPVWANGVGFVVSLLLSLWMFKAANSD